MPSHPSDRAPDSDAPLQETLLFGWLQAGASEPGRPQDTSDAIVVWSRGELPRVTRRFQLDTLECGVVEGESVDVEPLPTAQAWRGVVLGYVIEGELAVAQEGREVLLHQGQFVFYTSAQRYRIRSETAHRFLVVRIPTSAIALRHSLFTDVIATDLNSLPSAALLRGMLEALSRPEGLPTLAGRAHAADALVAGAHAVISDAREPGTAATMSQFNQLVVWIEDNLADADLSAERIAAEHFLSPRTVRRLFSINGTTVTSLVRQRRLERIRNELLDPSGRRVPIGVIASRWGLRDAASFSRAFTEHFGVSPKRYRALNLHQGAPVVFSTVPTEPLTGPL